MRGRRKAAARAMAVMLLITLLCGSAGADIIKYHGLEVDTSAEMLDLGDQKVYDWKEFYDLLDQMPNLKQVDMYGTVPNVRVFNTLNERYPNVKFGATLHIGKKYVRTDVTAFSTLFAEEGRTSGHDECAMLTWCPHLYALDLGHNPVKNLDFLYDLPDLRILIVAICNLTDITPIGSLKHLEYLEIFHNYIEDISCLSDLPYLMDLNVVRNRIQDITPVANIKSLKRLWIGRYNMSSRKGPDEETIRLLQEALPDCHIDWESTSTAGGWRKHPHYEQMMEMFYSREYHPFDDSDPENMPEPWRSEALKAGKEEETPESADTGENAETQGNADAQENGGERNE